MEIGNNDNHKHPDNIEKLVFSLTQAAIQLGTLEMATARQQVCMPRDHRGRLLDLDTSLLRGQRIIVFFKLHHFVLYLHCV